MTFEQGFAESLHMWHDGHTWEQIQAHYTGLDRSPFVRGALCAAEVLAGWVDSARLEAKLAGLTDAATERLFEHV